MKSQTSTLRSRTIGSQPSAGDGDLGCVLAGRRFLGAGHVDPEGDVAAVLDVTGLLEAEQDVRPPAFVIRVVGRIVGDIDMPDEGDLSPAREIVACPSPLERRDGHGCVFQAPIPGHDHDLETLVLIAGQLEVVVFGEVPGKGGSPGS